MGGLALADMLNHTTVEQALIWHLQGNHYPPISLSFLPAIKEAIQKVTDEDEYAEITLPNGVILPAYKIVSDLHLEYFFSHM